MHLCCLSVFKFLELLFYFYSQLKVQLFFLDLFSVDYLINFFKIELYLFQFLFYLLKIFPCFDFSRLSVCLSPYYAHMSIYVSVYLPTCLSFSLFISISIFLSICMSFYLSVYQSMFLSDYLPICLSICLSIYLSVDLSRSLSISQPGYLSVFLPFCFFLNFIS